MEINLTESILTALITLFTISGLSFPQDSPRDVLARFCELDAQGKQLSPDGWQEVAPLFSAAAPPRRDKIIVVRDFVISQPALKGKRAEFYVEYINLGQIDTSLRFSHLPPVKVRAGFDLALSDNGAEPGLDGTSTHVGEPARWRIEGTPPEPHLTVEAAIHYVNELRSKTKNVATARNADRTIAILKRLTAHP